MELLHAVSFSCFYGIVYLCRQHLCKEVAYILVTKCLDHYSASSLFVNKISHQYFLWGIKTKDDIIFIQNPLLIS